MGTTAAPATETKPKAAPTVIEAESDFVASLRRHQKAITIGAGSIVVLGLIGWYVVESGRRKQSQAIDELDRARSAMEASNFPEASSQLQKVAQTYAGTDAAYEATLALNQVRLMSGQAQLAVDELRKFLATNPPAKFASAGHAHLAMALENAGKSAEATPEYLKAAELATEGFRKVDALLAAARSYRVQGKAPEAIAVLQGIVKDYPKEAAGVAEAQVRLAEMTQGRS
jgi:tetratricopeptide (TPR) repeat protein